MRWQRAASPNRLSLLVGSSRLMLIKIGFDRGRATLVIAIGVRTGSKFFSNHSTMAAAEDGGPGGAKAHVCDLVVVGYRGCRGGIAAIGFGIPINEFTLGTTLIVAGISGLTGGLILIGLAAVVGELGRVAEALRTRVVARPAARPAEAQEPVAAAAAASAPARRPWPALRPLDRPADPATTEARTRAVQRAPSSRAPSQRQLRRRWTFGCRNRASAVEHSASRATQGRAFDRRGRRGGSAVP